MFTPMKEIVSENELEVDPEIAREKLLPIEIVFNMIREPLIISYVTKPIVMKVLHKNLITREDVNIATSPTVTEIVIKTQDDFVSHNWEHIFQKLYENKAYRECCLSFNREIPGNRLFGNFYGVLESIVTMAEHQTSDYMNASGYRERVTVGVIRTIDIKFVGVLGKHNKETILKREEKRIMIRKLYFD